jgi:hypothetical protein
MHIHSGPGTELFDWVLQENVVITAGLRRKAGRRTVSRSTDDTFGGYAGHAFPFSVIVAPDGPELFIHTPDSLSGDSIKASAKIDSTPGNPRVKGVDGHPATRSAASIR